MVPRKPEIYLRFIEFVLLASAILLIFVGIEYDKLGPPSRKSIARKSDVAMHSIDMGMIRTKRLFGTPTLQLQGVFDKYAVIDDVQYELNISKNKMTLLEIHSNSAVVLLEEGGSTITLNMNWSM